MSKNYTTIAIKNDTLDKIKELEVEVYWVKITNNSDKITFLIDFYKKHKDLI